MKFTGFYIPLFLLAAATGCVRSHRAATVVYTAPPTPTVVYTPPPAPLHSPLEPPSVPPTSRIITEEDINPPSEPPPGVSSQDLAIAESVSKLLKNDSHMATISENVQATVDRGVVSLHGTVPSENAMDEIATRIGKVPGVHHIEDHLSVGYR